MVNIAIPPGKNEPHIDNLEPFNPDLKVMSFDIENSIKEGNLLCICYAIREEGKLKFGPPIQGTEKEIIDSFTRSSL